MYPDVETSVLHGRESSHFFSKGAGPACVWRYLCLKIRLLMHVGHKKRRKNGSFTSRYKE